MNGITGNIDNLVRLLDIAGLRQRIIAHNIANVNTPGYQALEVSFEEELRRQLAAGVPDPLSNTQPVVRPSTDPTVRPDGNSVDIDREISRLSKNSLFYQAVTQILSVRIQAMRSAISGR